MTVCIAGLLTTTVDSYREARNQSLGTVLLVWVSRTQLIGGGREATMSKLHEMIEEVQSLQEKNRPAALQLSAPPGRGALPPQYFPFALLQ